MGWALLSESCQIAMWQRPQVWDSALYFFVVVILGQTDYASKHELRKVVFMLGL